MRENEAAAHNLVRALVAIGIEAQVDGEGVHWRVDVTPRASRTVVVHCFWYERAMSGLMLGMNPSNNRSRLRRVSAPSEGAEYLVYFFEDRVRVADGRTGVVAEVVECARAWLGGLHLAAVRDAAPFVDRKGRAMRAVAERLDPRLRWDIEGEPGYELWVYGEERSCKLLDVGGDVDSAFLIGQAQVAYGASLEDVPSAIATWLLHGVQVQQLPTRVSNVQLERHAEVLETDPGRWHWLHLRDRMNDPSDVLAPLRELVEELANRPVVTRFFSYSSLNRLCFSASSHFPWVDQGLPVVSTNGRGAYLVGDVACDFARAVEVIEATLAAYPISPFFGSAPHHELPLLTEHLAREGSLLRPVLQQQGPWYRLVVESGPRRCQVDGRTVVFSDGTSRNRASYGSLEDAARGVRSYLESGIRPDGPSAKQTS